MKKPKYLSHGDTIGLVAPAFGCTTEPYLSCFNAAIKRFKSWGYNIVEGPNCRKDDGVGISSTPKNCGKELTEFYCNNECDMLISCGGGELMCETMGYVDFNAIKSAPPKWFMGFSDNTNFTFLLNTMCDVASIYGQNFPSFGVGKPHQVIEDTFDIINGNITKVSGYQMFEIESLKDDENPFVGYNLTEQKILKLFYGNRRAKSSLKFDGVMVGGCLDCLANLVGTKFDHVREFNKRYRNEGVIWFLEACDLNIFAIRRALWNLANAGWFNMAKGFIIGRPKEAFFQEFMGLDRYSAVLPILGRFKVPIVMDADLGHLPPSLPIVSGAFATVEANKNITLQYEL